MCQFLESCITRYEELVDSPVEWKKACTPYMEDDDRCTRPREPLSKDEDALICPWCDAAFPKHCFTECTAGTADNYRSLSKIKLLQQLIEKEELTGKEKSVSRRPRSS